MMLASLPPKSVSMNGRSTGSEAGSGETSGVGTGDAGSSDSLLEEEEVSASSSDE
jgi:hypothetical protein